MQQPERMSVVYPIKCPIKSTMGATSSKFLIGLRDEEKIRAIKCPTCARIYMPPREACPTCLSHMDEWIELSGKGTITTYTIVFYSEEYHPAEEPMIYAIIQLDGADTGLTHLVSEVDLENLQVGMRVEPVFKEKREGTILDIKYFRPLKRT